MKIKELAENCYVPYSNKTAVAAVKSKSGEFFPGVNVENISFPLTVSAVQNAVYCCLSEGRTPAKIFVENPSDSLVVLWVEEYNLEVESINKAADTEFTAVLLKDINIKRILQRLFKRALVDNSDFPVSCLLKTEDGYISGVNIENRNWSYGLCAERVAIAKAFSYGFTNFEAAYISSRDGDYCSPCGACRQVLVEHLPDQKLHLFHPDGTKSEHFCSDLLPYSFQSSLLKNDG